MNSKTGPEEVFLRKAPFWQVKNAPMRVQSASAQPSLPGKTVRTETKITHPRTVQAAGWIDQNTDAYIQHRLRLSRQTIDPKFSRSKVVAEMLRERAADDTFERNQAVLVPIIQDTMRAMHKEFENRWLAVLAKIAYQVGWILSLLIRYMCLRIDPRLVHKIEADSETDGRVYVGQRTPQTEEVKARLLEWIEQMHPYVL